MSDCLTEVQRRACAEARSRGLDSWGFSMLPVPVVYMRACGGVEHVFPYPTRRLLSEVEAIADASPCRRS